MAEGAKKQQEWLFQFILFHNNPQQYLCLCGYWCSHTLWQNHISKSPYNIPLCTENMPIINWR